MPRCTSFNINLSQQSYLYPIQKATQKRAWNSDRWTNTDNTENYLGFEQTKCKSLMCLVLHNLQSL
jgi:hypothetical protein